MRHRVGRPVHRRRQLRGQAEHVLLHAVVQVALDPTSLGVRRLDDAGPGRADLVKLLAGGLRLKLGVLQRKPAGLHRRVEQAPVPFKRGIRENDRDRGTAFRADELHDAVGGLPGRHVARRIGRLDARRVGGRQVDYVQGRVVKRCRAARREPRSMSAPAEIWAISPVMLRSSRVRWVAATRNASGTVMSRQPSAM